jgi:hypothetical protein
VLEAWKEIPGAKEGLSVRRALKMADDHPELCPKFAAIIRGRNKAHRARMIATYIEKAINLGLHPISREMRKVYYPRRLPKNARRRYEGPAERYKPVPIDQPELFYIVH